MLRPPTPCNVRSMSTVDRAVLKRSSSAWHGEHTRYYGLNSGNGLALRETDRLRNRRVGVIGLGTGTLAAYGRPGDSFRSIRNQSARDPGREDRVYVSRGFQGRYRRGIWRCPSIAGA